MDRHTLFSTFLLPLTLIAGFYGMNVENMPELHWIMDSVGHFCGVQTEKII
ncbi:CorA family divalent cation transporter [Cyclobacterium xiamenense]|uniref:CorA family divalent cation transporter n=1 Tax=Cyclobacterium xiamenense TaxID=1297121 RepID=UPI0035D09138